MSADRKSTALVPAGQASTELAPASGPGYALLDTRMLEAGLTWAKQLATASLVPVNLRNKPADVLIIVMKGAELGFSPLQSLDLIHVIKGKPSVGAQGLVAKVKTSPVCEYFILVEDTDEVATYETKRKGEPKPQRMSFSMEDAKRAQLLSNSTWKSYPRNMLRARASAALAKTVYPDVTAGMTVYEELVGEPDEAPVFTAPQAPTTTQRLTPRAAAGLGSKAIDIDPAAAPGVPHHDEPPASSEEGSSPGPLSEREPGADDGDEPGGAEVDQLMVAILKAKTSEELTELYKQIGHHPEHFQDGLVEGVCDVALQLMRKVTTQDGLQAFVPLMQTIPAKLRGPLRELYKQVRANLDAPIS